MKKLMTLAALFAAIMMSLTACDKEGKKPGGNGNGNNDNDFESLITIDGDFSDWDAITSSKMVSATCAAGTKHSALTKVKVYADKMFINVYFEFDEAQIILKDWVPFHCYIDADNSATTGGDASQFSDKDAEVMLEGSIMSESFMSYNPALFKWWGEVGADDWAWTDPSVEHSDADAWGAILPEESGIASGAGTGNKYEIQIIREMIPYTFADTFGIGFDIQQDYSTVGILPNATISDDNTEGWAPKLRVTIDK